MEVVYLWLVLCMDGPACLSTQVYQVDAYQGQAAQADCRRARSRVAGKVEQSAPPGSALVCKTLAQFENQGVAF